jgi:uncharacterized protein
MRGQVVHFEIPAEDPERAYGFYRSAFEWDITPMPEMGYAALKGTPTDDQGRPTEPGSINGGMFRREDELTDPVITIGVDDIDKALQTIGDLGGSVVRAKMTVGDMGFAAYFRDTEGNIMGLWQNAG